MESTLRQSQRRHEEAPAFNDLAVAEVMRLSALAEGYSAVIDQVTDEILTTPPNNDHHTTAV